MIVARIFKGNMQTFVTPKIYISLTVIWNSSTILHFILDAITADYSSSFGMVRTLEFNGANRDLPIMTKIFMSLP